MVGRRSPCQTVTSSVDGILVVVLIFQSLEISFAVLLTTFASTSCIKVLFLPQKCHLIRHQEEEEVEKKATVIQSTRL